MQGPIFIGPLEWIIQDGRHPKKMTQKLTKRQMITIKYTVLTHLAFDNRLSVIRPTVRATFV